MLHKKPYYQGKIGNSDEKRVRNRYQMITLAENTVFRSSAFSDILRNGKFCKGVRQTEEVKMGNVYGYIRVSTKEQNEDRQVRALHAAQVPEKNIYMDKQSGKDFNRPMYQRLLNRLKHDDLLYIKSIDRLGRNYEEILEQWRILTKDKKVDIVVLDMPLLDTRRGKDLLGTFLSDIVLQVLSFVAENERKSIRERQKEGIEAAKQRGVQFGRPKKPLPENFIQISNRWLLGEIRGSDAARMCGMPVSSFYRKAAKNREET